MWNFKFFHEKITLMDRKNIRIILQWLSMYKNNCFDLWCEQLSRKKSNYTKFKKIYQHLYDSKLKKMHVTKEKLSSPIFFTSKISWNWFSHLYSHTYVSPDPIFILLLHQHIFTNWCTLKHNCYYTQLVLNISNYTTTTLCLLQNYVIM